MKKIIIITAISLIVISVHAQRTSREQSRHEPVKQKSETAVRRSAEQKQSSRSQYANRTRQANPQGISHANSHRSSTSKNLSAERSGANRTYFEKPGRVDHKPGNQVRESISSGSHAKKAPVRNPGRNSEYSGQRSAVERNSMHRASNNYTTERKRYTSPNRIAVRTNHVKAYHYNPVRYRTVNYHYRVPNRIHVTWTNAMYHDYRIMYPEFGYWYYPIGYRIVTVPSYHAYYHIGEVRNVYGRVHEVYYSWTTDEYHLYFGGNYPYHDFTVIIPGPHARKFARHPELYFEGRYIWVTGLLSTFEGRPELIVKRPGQIHLY